MAELFRFIPSNVLSNMDSNQTGPGSASCKRDINFDGFVHHSFIAIAYVLSYILAQIRRVVFLKFLDGGVGCVGGGSLLTN